MEMFEGKALFQMKFYGLILWRLRGEVPTMLQLIYLGNGEILRYRPDEADLLAVERKVNALWTAIQRAAETGDWRPRKSALCGWCSHQALCPEFGGTPPPLLITPQADIADPGLWQHTEIVAYCRGPYCAYADRAVELLRSNGRRARRLVQGFPEWKASGLPFEATPTAS